jgi:hypothetical protein
MSQPVKTRPAPPPQALLPQTPRRDADGTGRFKIAAVPDGSTMLPPRGRQGDVLSLEALDGVMETESQNPVLESTSEPERGVTSGVFDSEPRTGGDRGGFDGLAEPVIALQPYYRSDEGQSDRAQLQIDDFSLQVGNPFLASSLVPPARSRLELGRLLRIAGAATLALAAVASAAWLVSRNAATPRPSDARPRVAVAPIAPASPAKPADLAPPEPTAAEARPSSTVAPAAKLDGPAHSATSVGRAAAIPSAVTPTVPTRPALAVLASELPAPHGVAAAVAVAPTTRAVPVAAEADPTAAVEPPASASTTDPSARIAASDESGALPEAPARADIVAGFEQIRDDLVKCAGGKHGIVDIDATIANSGRVAHALIDGAFKGTPEGSCIARAVRTAHFPRFSQASLKVDYPLSL